MGKPPDHQHNTQTVDNQRLGSPIIEHEQQKQGERHKFREIAVHAYAAGKFGISAIAKTDKMLVPPSNDVGGEYQI